MSSPDKLARLSERLRKVNDARTMAQTDVWDEAWAGYERELLERLLACGPEDEMARWKLQQAIGAVRNVKRGIENAGAGAEQIEREIRILTGDQVAPIA